MRKINVHMTVDESTLEFCKEINKEIRSITNSTIIYSENSLMVPHMTIVMGKLDENIISMDNFFNMVAQLAKNIKPINFNVYLPYLEDVVNKYIFCDVNGGKKFLHLREKFKNEFSNNILHDIGGSYGKQPPHLTLGHIEDKQREIRDYLSSIKRQFDFISDKVEISDVGPKGSCLGSIASITL